MIRIIKEGKLPTFKIKCDNCGCLFEYDEREIENKFVQNSIPKYISYIKCPYCRKNIYFSDKNNKEIR